MIPVSEYTMYEKVHPVFRLLEETTKKCLLLCSRWQWMAHSFPCSSFLAEKPRGVTQNWISQKGFMWRKIQNTGLTLKQRKNAGQSYCALCSESKTRAGITYRSQRAIIIWDTFKGQNNNDIRNLLKELNLVEAVMVPAFNQPLDVSVNRPCKHFMWEKVQGWYASEVEKVVNGQKPDKGHRSGNGHTLDARENLTMADRLTITWIKTHPSLKMDGGNMA